MFSFDPFCSDIEILNEVEELKAIAKKIENHLSVLIKLQKKSLKNKLWQSNATNQTNPRVEETH